jgi:hypothetical protein
MIVRSTHAQVTKCAHTGGTASAPLWRRVVGTSLVLRQGMSVEKWRGWRA